MLLPISPISTVPLPIIILSIQLSVAYNPLHNTSFCPYPDLSTLIQLKCMKIKNLVSHEHTNKFSVNLSEY